MSTAIAGVSSGQSWSPMNRVQNQLQRAVNNGSVKADDQDALTAALTDISAQLQSNAANGTGTSATPTSTKSTIDGLISGEVSSGKLTSDQAGELKSVFADAAKSMHGHHHRMGGAGAGNDDSDTSTDPTSATASTTATSFASFLQQLESSLAQAVDGVTGTTATGATTATGETQASSGVTDTASASQSASNPKQLMLSFLKQLETALGANNTYSATGTSGSMSGQAVLVNAMA